MIFKWLKAKNILSIGNKGIYIQFDKLDNIVNVKGKNLDVSPESSNGAGKSTLIECLIYGLFGKLIKGLPHKEAINKKTKKNLEIQLCFELDGHDYVIERGRKPDFLRLFKNGVDETLGGMPDTQKEIENIVKLNYESFINVVCFGEHNNHAFLACDAATKRSIVENLLGLEKYLKYSKIAKEGLKEIETKLAVIRKKYESATEQRDNCLVRLGQLDAKRKAWIAAKEKEIDNINFAISLKTKEMNETDDGQATVLYQKAQDRIRVNKDEIVKLEEQRAKIAAMLDQIREKLELYQDSKNTCSLALKTKESEIAARLREESLLQSQIVSMKKLQPGVKCTACFGTVDPNNYQPLIDHNQGLINRIKDEVVNLNTEKSAISERLQSHVNDINKMVSLKKHVDERNNVISSKLNELITSIQHDSQVKEPQVGAKELLIKEQIAELNYRLESKKEELDNQDPYIEILNQTKNEKVSLDEKIDVFKENIDEGEAQVPYYEFWIHGFGDDGIRAFIIDGILPTLNARINYWLQFLIDNKIILNFDNKFDVTIERNPADGDPFVYNATSGGERRRINLAISQAFAHVMVASSGTYPSIISLDEVALNVDLPGVHGIYKMICELSKERQVFVTTHDPNLNDLLNSCDILTVVKDNGFTEIEVVKVAA